MAEVFYNLRKKFCGNFRHFKFPTFALGLTNRAPAKTLGASVICARNHRSGWQIFTMQWYRVSEGHIDVSIRNSWPG